MRARPRPDSKVAELAPTSLPEVQGGVEGIRAGLWRGRVDLADVTRPADPSGCPGASRHPRLSRCRAPLATAADRHQRKLDLKSLNIDFTALAAWFLAAVFIASNAFVLFPHCR